MPLITAISTVKSVSLGIPGAQPKWVWHPPCATQVGLAPLVRNSSRPGTPGAQFKSVWHP